jgi:intraflagellar transport protein 140
LAIGWENGTITLWNEENKMAKEEAQAHKDKVNLIVFNDTAEWFQLMFLEK